LTHVTKQRLLIGGVGLLAAAVGFLAWKFFQSAADPDQVNLPSQTNSVGMMYLKVPAGTFTMGSPNNELGRDGDEEQHAIEITRPFWLGTCEVTRQQFESVMGYKPVMIARLDPQAGKDKPKEDREEGSRPVENLTFAEAVEFCRKLSELPKEKEARRSYRLPTEAEWEYACRAGTTTPYAFGRSLNESQANTGQWSKNIEEPLHVRSKQTEPVGKKPANRWGFHDMHGNAFEWCSDWYDPTYYSRSPRQDPQGPPTGEKRVVRGGSSASPPEACRSANRMGFSPEIRLGVGFRVVLVEEGK
jgi:formylglycine-generating enzyme required for sulfatase activity